MFENVFNFLKKIGKKDKIEEKSKDTAKERLHLVLMQDRANVSADFLDMMRQEIIEVIKKYIDVDEKDIDVRLTNKTNEDGTVGAPALYANIPITGIKEEVKREKETNENATKKVNQDNTKKEAIKQDKKEKVETSNKEVDIKSNEEANIEGDKKADTESEKKANVESNKEVSNKEKNNNKANNSNNSNNSNASNGLDTLTSSNNGSNLNNKNYRSEKQKKKANKK